MTFFSYISDTPKYYQPVRQCTHPKSVAIKPQMLPRRTPEYLEVCQHLTVMPSLWSDSTLRSNLGPITRDTHIKSFYDLHLYWLLMSCYNLFWDFYTLPIPKLRNQTRWVLHVFLIHQVLTHITLYSRPAFVSFISTTFSIPQSCSKPFVESEP